MVEVTAGFARRTRRARAGDILLKVGQRSVSNAESLQKLLFAEAIGEPIDLAVLRDGAELRLVAVPAEMTENQ